MNAAVNNGLTFAVGSATLGGLSGSGNVALANGGSPVALTVGGNNANTTYSGVLSGGSSSLLKTGTGTMTLSGPNTYGGATTISAGTLQLGNGAAGNDGSLATNGISDNAALVYNLFGSQAPGYGISGTGSLTKLGTGMLTLAASNSYSGPTTISAGTLQIGGGGVLGTAITAEPSLSPTAPPCWPSPPAATRRSPERSAATVPCSRRAAAR